MQRFRIVFLACLIGLAGCARYPDNPAQTATKRLVVTLAVAGRINTDYYYFMAIDNSSDLSVGPLPVVFPPWGNGWGTGSISHFLRYDKYQPNGYGVYRMIPNTQLLAADYLGRPLDYTAPQTNTLQFTLSIDSLATAAIPIENLAGIKVNFITTNEVPVDPTYPGLGRFYDALGGTGNSYIAIDLGQNRIYTNQQATQPELPGDCPDADLDIVGWTIEVRVS
ncbi:MAG: hypothetical protein IT210_13400 [Armatimonadetes bacterium]|nr:hypothetical protein [Armatimonadota bacterium]